MIEKSAMGKIKESFFQRKYVIKASIYKRWKEIYRAIC